MTGLQDNQASIAGSNPKNPPHRLIEVGTLFLRMGLTAFGGPAAHIAMFQLEVVNRRKWLSNAHFLDLLGATNLIPGPNSTEMAIHIGYVRAGWPGLILAGVSFIAPAMVIVLGLAALYIKYGSLPQLEFVLYGIKPVMIAIILQAFWGLYRTAINNYFDAAVALLIFCLYFLDIHPILLLLLGALIFFAPKNFMQRNNLASGLLLLPTLTLQASNSVIPYNLWTLFLTFLKIGSVLYGSGYVLLAFLESEFVTSLGWLTEQQLLEAISVGQLTPGPVFTTATFIGYILGGVPGALLATIGIFLPSFIFVALSNPLIPRLRNSKWTAALVDGVILASLGMMAAVTVLLGKAALIDPLSIFIALLACVALFRFKINSTWLILAGGLIGFANFFLN